MFAPSPSFHPSPLCWCIFLASKLSYIQILISAAVLHVLLPLPRMCRAHTQRLHASKVSIPRSSGHPCPALRFSRPGRPGAVRPCCGGSPRCFAWLLCLGALRKAPNPTWEISGEKRPNNVGSACYLYSRVILRLG